MSESDELSKQTINDFHIRLVKNGWVVSCDYNSGRAIQIESVWVAKTKEEILEIIKANGSMPAEVSNATN